MVVAELRVRLGNEHPDTLAAIGHLGVLLFELGKPGEALPLMEEALAGRQAVLGADHPKTELAARGVIACREKLRAASVPSGLGDGSSMGAQLKLTSISNCGLQLQSMGGLDEAEALLEEALAGRRAMLGATHPDTLDSVENLAKLRVEQHRPGDALLLSEEALVGRRAALGEEHPSTRRVAGAVKLLRHLTQLVARPWACPRCTFENKGTAPQCAICACDRPRCTKLNLQSWACPRCTFENEEKAVQCGVCSYERSSSEETAGRRNAVDHGAPVVQLEEEGWSQDSMSMGLTPRGSVPQAPPPAPTSKEAKAAVAAAAEHRMSMHSTTGKKKLTPQQQKLLDKMRKKK